LLVSELVAEVTFLERLLDMVLKVSPQLLSVFLTQLVSCVHRDGRMRNSSLPAVVIMRTLGVPAHMTLVQRRLEGGFSQGTKPFWPESPFPKNQVDLLVH